MAAAATRDDGDRDLKTNDETGDCARNKEEGDSLYEPGEMLRLREEYWELLHLSSEEKFVPGALDRWLERNRKNTHHNNNKKVARIMVPNSYIDEVIKKPQLMEPETMSDAIKEILTDEEIARHLEEYSQSYAIAKLINAKYHEYRQALISQYDTFGFAYDEYEVTDDDKKEEVAAVVKN